MKLFPYNSFRIEADENPSSLLEHLRRHIVPYEQRFSPNRDARFCGTVDLTGFKCRPIFRYRNSFRPVVVGRFQPTERGVSIQVIMRLSIPSLIFLVVWFAVLGPCLVVGMFRSPILIHHTEDLAYTALALIFAWGLSTFCFWRDGNQINLLLSDLINNKRK